MAFSVNDAYANPQTLGFRNDEVNLRTRDFLIEFKEDNQVKYKYVSKEYLEINIQHLSELSLEFPYHWIPKTLFDDKISEKDLTKAKQYGAAFCANHIFTNDRESSRKNSISTIDDSATCETIVIEPSTKFHPDFILGDNDGKPLSHEKGGQYRRCAGKIKITCNK